MEKQHEMEKEKIQSEESMLVTVSASISTNGVAGGAIIEGSWAVYSEMCGIVTECYV